MGFATKVNPELGSFSFGPAEPELYAKQCLLQRVHDIYVSSPNCSQPGFSHSQGSMYLAPKETKWCPLRRVMDSDTRQAKIKELFQQLKWLEEQLEAGCVDCSKPYMVGGVLTLADMCWAPTIGFMEYLLPRNFGWPCVVTSPETPFPCVQRWYKWVCEDSSETKKSFGSCRSMILGFWDAKDKEGMFEALRELVFKEEPERKWAYSKADL